MSLVDTEAGDDAYAAAKAAGGIEAYDAILEELDKPDPATLDEPFAERDYVALLGRLTRHRSGNVRGAAAHLLQEHGHPTEIRKEPR